MSHSGPYYFRLNLYHRLLHAMVITSFLGLAVTGLPLKYSHTRWGKWLSALLGGPGTTGYLHRFFAVITTRRPNPTSRPGLLRIPAPTARTVEIRFARMTDRDVFDPDHWRRESLNRAAEFTGWWEFDLDALALADGAWEYEFLLDGNTESPVADPWAEEITRFNGYRGVFHVAGSGFCVPRFVGMTKFRPA